MEGSSPLRAVRRFTQHQTRASLQELQASSVRAALLEPLHASAPSAEDRQRLQTRSSGVPALDQLMPGEVLLALKLSDELSLNEVAAARLVARAKELQPESADAERLQLAAGLHFEVRADCN